MAEAERPEKARVEPTGQRDAPPPPEQPPQEPMSVPQTILFSISLLSEVAWQKLGLHLDPVTKKVETDLPQARLAIDAVGALVEIVKGHVDEKVYRELRTLLANLQLNFAHQAQRQQAQASQPSSPEPSASS